MLDKKNSSKITREVNKGGNLFFQKAHILNECYSSFCVLVRNFFTKSSYIRNCKGAILILIACFIPIVLLGVKYAKYLFINKEMGLRVPENSSLFKRCAREAALAVAKNWNPGLTLGQQRAGIYKVADAVYNAHPCLTYSSLGSAIPGAELKSSSGTQISNLIASAKTVTYSHPTKYVVKWCTSCSYWNRHCGLWLGVDKGTDSSNRQSMFDEVDENKLANAEYVLNQHEIYQEPHPYGFCRVGSAPTDTDYDTSWHDVILDSASTSTGSPPSKYNFYKNLNSYKANNSSPVQSLSHNSTLSTSTYSVRSTGVDANYVKISIASDASNGGKIAVETDQQIAYAVPAKCDVDIVLAVPVNGAACNTNNRDLASDTAENPHYYDSSSGSYTIPSDAKQTPVYQMGQACKAFVRDHFFHTRGVYMSLIPYSGKLSIPPDRGADWTTPCPQFVDTSGDTQVMIGACLYGTQGQKDAPLKRSNITTTIKSGLTVTSPYFWGGLQHGCPIMCRRGEQTADERYGSNYADSGILTETSSPNNSNPYYSYRRMNLNPCYLGYANMLSMRCEKECTYYSANPYYVIEPTTDLVKIYEMCNALTPFYDPQNVSNFVFLPIEWARNFFEKDTDAGSTWNRDEPTETVTGSGDTAVLKRDSKTAAGRKKALILLVNKPDWFEPGELTYLGFDNDASEIPMAESDKIDFSIDYGDTSKKFLDGTAYDGTIQGQKKILKFTGNVSKGSSGFYEANGYNVSCLLKFPHKGTVKLVVEPSISIDGIDSKIVSNSSESVSISNRTIVGGFPESNFTNITDGTSSTADHSNRKGGKEFGTNFSLKKLKINRNGIDINDIILKNQVLRKYGGIVISGGRIDPAVHVFSTSGITEGTYEFDNTSSSAMHIQCSFMGVKRGQIVLSQYRSSSSDPLRLYLYTGSVGAESDSVSGWDGCSGTLIYDKSQSGDIFIKSVEFTSNSDNSYISLYRPAVASSRWVVHEILCKNLDAVHLNSSITSLSDPLLVNNRAVALIKEGDEEWICFNGDGQLSIDAQPTTFGTVGTLSFSNPAPNTSNPTITAPEYTSSLPSPPKIENSNVAALNNLPVQTKKTYIIEPSEITDTDSDGNYYISMNLMNVRLISAEITNCTPTAPSKTSTTYNEIDVLTPTNGSGTYLSWGSRSVSVPQRTIDCTSSLPLSDGSFKLSNDNSMAYNSSYGGIAPTSTDTWGTLTITSDTNASVTMSVNRISDGSVTFYSDNIGSTYDVRKGGTEGPLITLDTVQNISGTQTFVFKGWTQQPTAGEIQDYQNSTEGVNFGHNLSMYKVRYSLQGAVITNCVLKKQVVRDYVGQYGRYLTKYPALITNNGVLTSRSSDSAGYTPSYNNLSFDCFRDLCIQLINSSSCSSNDEYAYWSMPEFNVYGIQPPFCVYTGSSGAEYYTNSGSYTSLSSSSGWTWASSGRISTASAYSDRIQIRGTDSQHYQTYVYSFTDKTFIPDISDSDLIYNKGIGLKYLSSQLNNIPVGYWICFQGDGELHVTVQGTDKDNCYKINSDPQQTIPSDEYTFTVPPEAFTKSGDTYTAEVHLYNACLTKAVQEAGSKSYSCLLSSQSGTAILAQNNSSGSRSVGSYSLSSYDSSLSRYYYDLGTGYSGQFAAIAYSETEPVYDVIDFYNSTTSKYGYLKQVMGGSFAYNLYTIDSSSSSQISSIYRGNIELTVAPSFSNTSNSGTIKQNFGSNTSTNTITNKNIITINGNDLKYDGFQYYMSFTIENLTILKAKLVSAEARFVYPLSLDNASYINWQDATVSIPSNVSITGSYSTDSSGTRMLNTSNFCPSVGHSGWASDITAVFNADTVILNNIIMPEQTYSNDTFLLGLVRLFSPLKRTSTHNYAQLQPYSSTYNDKAAMLAHTFTSPYNSVLYKNGYQTSGKIPTRAAANVTADLCSKLKSDYGSNVRIYVVKYRPQQNYKTFPFYGVTQSNSAHDYTAVDGCATSSEYLYSVGTEAELKTTLDTIAANIKTWAGYKDAKLVD